MSTEFFRRRAVFDDLGHRVGVGLCVLIAAATVMMLALSFDPRYDLGYQAAGFLSALIFATTLGLASYLASRAIARLVHRLKFGSAGNQLDWQGGFNPRKMTNNLIALISGGALAAAGMLFRLITGMVSGFPQGAGYAIGRMVAAGLIFLIVGYLLAHAIQWGMQKYKSSQSADSNQ
ncbi:hypothetical protein [Anderseniella sp. Alg231-50]|uniref:hypothetical protein n=1 Tax=Anderseniella sp. Alg231-50 TaxID=1922226 RepID=UPI000D55779D